MESKCPNCQVRPADMDIEFHEVLHSRYQSRMWAMGWWQDRSIRGFYKYGRARLCARCAANYWHVVQMRTIGMRALNYGFAALLAGAVLFGIGAAAMPGWSTGISGLLLASPMVLALLVMLAGGTLYVVGVVRRPAATRFVERVHVYTPSAPSTPMSDLAAPIPEEGSSSSPSPRTNWTRLSPEERAAARARRRRRRRLTWIGLGVAWVAAVVAAVLIYTNTIGHFSLISQGVQHFTDPLISNARGWPNRDACTFHDGAYHIAPVNNGEGVTCFSPAGGYTNFDLHVTAQVVSGSPDAGYGLAFRAADGGDEYEFEVTTNGLARMDVVILARITPLSPVWTVPGGPLGLNTPHQLRVVARGDTFTCFVDNAQVGTLTDNRYSHGLVGLSVTTLDIDVAFTDFAVSAV